MEDELRLKFITSLNTPARLERIDNFRAEVREVALHGDEKPCIIFSEPIASAWTVMLPIQMAVEKLASELESPYEVYLAIEPFYTKKLQAMLLNCYAFFKDELKDEHVDLVLFDNEVADFHEYGFSGYALEEN